MKLKKVMIFLLVVTMTLFSLSIYAMPTFAKKPPPTPPSDNGWYYIPPPKTVPDPDSEATFIDAT